MSKEVKATMQRTHLLAMTAVLLTVMALGAAFAVSGQDAATTAAGDTSAASGTATTGTALNGSCVGGPFGGPHVHGGGWANKTAPASTTA
jgi:hypothetical protein